MRQTRSTWSRRITTLGFAVVVIGVLSGPPAGRAAEKPGTKEVKGRVQSVDAQAGRIVLTVRGKEMTFEVPPDLRGELAKLKTGDRVEIDYEEQDGKLIAATIEED